ncbi:MAG: MFS transporter [Myxococcota bacterium]|nr:hypothetical protein [Deltaproteobacteria bacterium]MCP4239570.1 MFS transporter [bacterium]MDP6075341.1 MFS transporter [Myxococcota bacterium]MDP6242953.1 MFS transporter [Myxococcota bacterium]MDP7073983.1 MFS transporter [Myxococcota bacterium]
MNQLRRSTKFAYGIGQVAEGIKTRGFDYFAFFYFTQVLGLSGSLAGLAVAAALVFDAFTDPIAGHLSDNWKSRLGRRHPFMYAAAAPLALAWFLLFFPPSELGQTGLFLWFLGFAVLVRASMTLYHVPHMALGAELSDDYAERTSVVQYRTLSGMVGGFGVILLGLQFFFPETPAFRNGLLDPSGYPAFAFFTGLVMFVTVWYSAWGTRREIPHLPAPPENPQPFSLRATFEEFRLAWENHSFRALFVGTSAFAVSISIGTTLGTHLNVFFWGFSTGQISILFIALAIGFGVGVLLSGYLHRHFDKKPSLLVACLVSSVAGSAAVALRLMDLLPANGEALLLYIVSSLLFAMGVMAGVGYTSAGSMMADVAYDQFLRTGRNQQGILFAATALSGKLGSAGGHFLVGVGIDLIRFPLKADPAAVIPDLIVRLGVLSLVSAPFALAGVYAISRYRISRESYEASRRGVPEVG